jgi:hypothetical protein
MEQGHEPGSLRPRLISEKASSGTHEERSLSAYTLIEVPEDVYHQNTGAFCLTPQSANSMKMIASV